MQELRLTERAERMLNEHNIPGLVQDALREWILLGRGGGHFIRGVLTNNLTAAITRADLENRRALYDIVIWLYNNAPAECWGSKEKVEAWRGCEVVEGTDKKGRRYSFWRIPDPEEDE